MPPVSSPGSLDSRVPRFTAGDRAARVRFRRAMALMLMTLVLPGSLGFHQPVALQALERRVDLADVERPDVPGPFLELLTELQSVLRAFAQ